MDTSDCIRIASAVDEIMTTVVSDPDSAFAAALAARFAGRDSIVLVADDHGLKGDWTGGVGGSGTNDTAALQTLVDSAPEGATIRFSPSRTYRLDSVIATKSLVIDGAGANLVVSPNTGGGPVIRFSGTASAPHALTPSTEGRTSVTVATQSDAAGYVVGDLVYISDNRQQTNWAGELTPHYGRGEIRRIVGIVSGELRLDGAIEWSYDASPLVRKVSLLRAPVIRDFGRIEEIDPASTGTPDSSNTAGHIFAFDLCDRPVVEDVAVHGWELHIATFLRCLAPAVRRIRGVKPFRPTTGGCGYVARFDRCHSGIAESLHGEGVRHVLDQVVSYDSGSRNCTGLGGVNVQFYLHGTLSKRAFSTDDVVNGPSVGWGMGNPSFGADYGFTITRPVYRGGHYASTIRAGAVGMRILDPDFASTTDSQTSLAIPRGIVGMFEAASDLVIEGGTIQIVGAASSSYYAVRVSPQYGTAALMSGWEPGDITIRHTRFQGANAKLIVNAAGDIGLDGVICDTQFTESGVAWVSLSPSIAARSISCRALRDTATATYRKGIVVGLAPSGAYEIVGCVLPQSINSTAGGFEGPVTGHLVMAENRFRFGALISLSGDIEAAKNGGARFYGNVPPTFDAVSMLNGLNTRADSGATLTARTTRPLQIWSAPLTANRTVTLDAAGAQAGDTFRVVRTASATGSSTLTLGSTGKVLAPGEWADLAFDGSAWLVIAAGAL